MNGLYALKPWYTARLSVLVGWAVSRQMSPDVFTAAGVLAAAGAAVTLAAGWWAASALLLAARLAGANLDGAVARARGVSRPFGFVLNELGDRAGDLLLWAGLAALALAHPPAPTRLPWAASQVAPLVMVLVAACAASLPTFVSLAGAGAGATRVNGGPCGKTERCLAAVLACAVPNALPLLMVAVAVGSVATAALRVRRVRSELSPAGERP